MAQERFRLTVEERILLHLLRYNRFREELEAPWAVTQEGIANAIGILRSAVPRSVRRLLTIGQLEEEVAHVKGITRRRKTYFLSSPGVIRGQNIQEKLKQKEVSLDVDSKTERLSLGVIIKQNEKRISPLSLIQAISDDGVLDIERALRLEDEATSPMVRSLVERHASKDSTSTIFEQTEQDVEIPEEDGLAELIQKAPQIKQFFGREREMEIIEGAFASPTVRIIFIHGIPGVGKTTLAAYLLEKKRGDSSLLWFRAHEWDSLRNLLTPISDLLYKIGRPQLSKRLKEHQGIDINEVAEILETDLDDSNAILFFDDLHRAPKPILQFFSLFVEILERVDRVWLIIASRRILGIYDRREVNVKKLVEEIPLGGLEMDAVGDILRSRGISTEDVEALQSITKGHPLALELLSPPGKRDGPELTDINRYIEEEVFYKLTDSENEVLQLLSVFRYPIPQRAIFEMEAIPWLDPGTVHALRNRGLLIESEGGLEIHDLLKEFFYSRLAFRKRKEFHILAGNLYSDLVKTVKLSKEMTMARISEKAIKEVGYQVGLFCFFDQNGKPQEDEGLLIMENIHHLLAASEVSDAVTLALDKGPQLIESGHIENLLNIVNKINPSETKNAESYSLLSLEGDIHSRLGEWNLAMTRYVEAIEMVQGLIDGDRDAKGGEDSGDRDEEDGEDSRDRDEEDGEDGEDREGEMHHEDEKQNALAYLHQKLGRVKEKLGQLDSAMEDMKMSLEIFRRIDDPEGLTTSLGDLGGIYWKMGDYETANTLFHECSQTAECLENLPGKIKLFLDLSLTCAQSGDLEGSLRYYEKSIDLLESNQDILSFDGLFQTLGDRYLEILYSNYIQGGGNRDDVEDEAIEDLEGGNEMEEEVAVNEIEEEVGVNEIEVDDEVDAENRVGDHVYDENGNKEEREKKERRKRK